MPYRHPAPEVLLESGQCLRSQADFRDQNQGLRGFGLRIIRQALLQVAYVDFGLATSGNAEQKVGLEGIGVMPNA